MGPADFMRRAIQLGREAMAQGERPFGAVVVCDGAIVAEGRAGQSTGVDPTAHAELSAIRAAAAKLGRTDLSDCDLYASCDPCPMCCGAVWYAGLRKVYYGITQVDLTEAFGRDTAATILAEIGRPLDARVRPHERLLTGEARSVLDEWKKTAHR